MFSALSRRSRAIHATSVVEDGRSLVVAGPVDGPLETLLSVAVADGPITALAVQPGPVELVAVGTERGVVLLYEEGVGERFRVETGLPGIAIWPWWTG